MKADPGCKARALAAVFLATLLGLTATAAPAQAADRPAGVETLAADFNADAGKVRLLLLLDPT